jgi:hypothetical protein
VGPIHSVDAPKRFIKAGVERTFGGKHARTVRVCSNAVRSVTGAMHGQTGAHYATEVHGGTSWEYWSQIAKVHDARYCVLLQAVVVASF